jgi:hypothetical protein
MAIRGSGVVYVNNADTGTINLPGGSSAGDECILITAHSSTDVLVPPLGFEYIDTTAHGSTFKCNLTSRQIGFGSVNVGFSGIGYGSIAIVVFVGPQAGIRTLISQSGSSHALTETLATDATPQVGDYAIYFGASVYNSNITSPTTTSSSGSTLTSSSNPRSAAIVASNTLGGSGATSSTFTFSNAPTSDYEVIVVVAPTPISGLQLRAPLAVVESLPEGLVSLKAPLVTTEALEDSFRQVRDSLVVVEPLADMFRQIRCPLVVIESLHPVEPEGAVSTELFPGSQDSSIALPGLQWPIHKIPMFNTAVYKGAPGVSVRRANMQYPIWQFELSYEFLRDSVNQEFQILMDFFLARQGGFDTFLFKDKNDYQVTNGFLGTGDGVTTQFAFKRTFAGTFYDKVGQVDDGNTITLYGTVAEANTIPDTPGPYTVTVANSATFVADVGVTKSGVPMVHVAGAPAAGQYSYAAGVYTFNSADHNQPVVITYRYTLDPLTYTITLPNLVVFTSAPATGLIISADFQFFFNCRFQDDAADFDQFAVTFWELQKIVLETVPQ